MRSVVTLVSLALAGCYLSHDPLAVLVAEPRTYDCPPGVVGSPEACGDGFDQDCDGIDPPCPAQVCGDPAAVEAFTTTIPFPDPGGCPWSDGDNAGPLDGVFRARTEQVASLLLPSGAIVCALHVEANADDLVFDDELIVTFARTVLVQSFDPTSVFDSRAGLPAYDWLDLAGQPLPRAAVPWCLGEQSTCALPRSEEHGRLALALTDAIGQALGEAGIREGGAELAVVTTGDNNRASDCRHTPFDLVVSAAFVAQ